MRRNFVLHCHPLRSHAFDHNAVVSQVRQTCAIVLATRVAVVLFTTMLTASFTSDIAIAAAVTDLPSLRHHQHQHRCRR